MQRSVGHGQGGYGDRPARPGADGSAPGRSAGYAVESALGETGREGRSDQPPATAVPGLEEVGGVAAWGVLAGGGAGGGGGARDAVQCDLFTAGGEVRRVGCGLNAPVLAVPSFGQRRAGGAEVATGRRARAG